MMTDVVAIAGPRRSLDSLGRRASSKPRPYRLPGLVSPLPRPTTRPIRSKRRAGLVLIIDDSLHTRELYTEYLVHTGLAVTAAAEAETGLELAQALRPDIIVMDIAMPGLNGITATHRLKQSPRTRRIPVIVLTGYAFRAIEQGALEAGADAFLTKPCLPEDLELKIRELLPPGRS
jgi:two-component system cell cycle response regulator DivK